MKKTLALLLLATIVCIAVPAQANQFAKFKDIKIFDDILVFVDVDGEGIDKATIRDYAIEAFKKDIPEMELNDDAWVENYPAEGYTIENVGYIMIKLMSIRTKSGMNVYHLNFDTGIPPREVYWDTATMGVAPTTFDLNKEVKEDIGEVMKAFADTFHQARQ